MDKSHTHSVIMCDECGYIEHSLEPEFTKEELIADTKATLMSVKTYFQDAGWYTSYGYDVCPACREKKGL